jgi:hypothetical protein
MFYFFFLNQGEWMQCKRRRANATPALYRQCFIIARSSHDVLEEVFRGKLQLAVVDLRADYLAEGPITQIGIGRSELRGC